MLGSCPNFRYSFIREQMGNITDAVLSASLKELISFQIVSRVSYDEIPPRVEYTLTDKVIAYFAFYLSLVWFVF
ncbi:MAG: helix-turn-helix transcriptional regulator [Succinatimonas sp.]|nr:helix-turn-helix transcriptional regulator [Succinatimonas sp.]